jgi:hypothetical protein
MLAKAWPEMADHPNVIPTPLACEFLIFLLSDRVTNSELSESSEWDIYDKVL